MRKFAINVNGKSFEVEVEEIGGGMQPQMTSAPAAPKAAAPISAPAPVQTQAPTGTINVTAPMPGNIWKLLVSVGDTVAEAQAVVVLEAMKMENELFSPKAGKVVGISVKQGDTVDTGDIIISIA